MVICNSPAPLICADYSHFQAVLWIAAYRRVYAPVVLFYIIIDNSTISALYTVDSKLLSKPPVRRVSLSYN